MKDAASRIAANHTVSGDWGASKRAHMTRDINRAIRRAVNAERERCCGIVVKSTEATELLTHDRMCASIIRKINTPAKNRPSKRKGRR